jgi:hypothetical protein
MFDDRGSDLGIVSFFMSDLGTSSGRFWQNNFWQLIDIFQ